MSLPTITDLYTNKTISRNDPGNSGVIRQYLSHAFFAGTFCGAEKTGITTSYSLDKKISLNASGYRKLQIICSGADALVYLSFASGAALDAAVTRITLLATTNGYLNELIIPTGVQYLYMKTKSGTVNVNVNAWK